MLPDALTIRNEQQLKRNGRIIFTVLVSAATVLILSPLLNLPNAELLVPLGILCLVWATVVPILKFRFDFMAALPMAAMLILIAYVLKPIYLTWIGEHMVEVGASHYQISLLDQKTIAGTWYTVIFSIAIIMAYLLAGGSIGRNVPWLPRNWNPKAIRWLIPIMITSGLIGWAIVIIFWGNGLGVIFKNVFVFRYFIFETPGLYHTRNLLMWLLWSAFWLILLSKIVTGTPIDRATKFRLFAYFIFLEVISIGLGQRFLIIMPVVYLIIVFNLTRRKIGILRVLGLGAFAGAVSYCYAIYRNLSWTGATLDGLYQELLSTDTNVFSMIAEGIISSVNRFEYLPTVIAEFNQDPMFGKTLLHLFLIPFPMSLFPERPIYIETFLTREILYRGNESVDFGIAWGAMAEWYINFHVFGIVVAGFLIGLLLRAIHNFIESNKSNPSVLLIYINGYVNFVTIPFSLIAIGFYSAGTVEFLFFFVLNICLTIILAVGTRWAGSWNASHIGFVARPVR